MSSHLWIKLRVRILCQSKRQVKINGLFVLNTSHFRSSQTDSCHILEYLITHLLLTRIALRWSFKYWTIQTIRFLALYSIAVDSYFLTKHPQQKLVIPTSLTNRVNSCQWHHNWHYVASRNRLKQSCVHGKLMFGDIKSSIQGIAHRVTADYKRIKRSFVECIASPLLVANLGSFMQMYTGDLLCNVLMIWNMIFLSGNVDNGLNIMLLKSLFRSALQMTGELEQFWNTKPCHE